MEFHDEDKFLPTLSHIFSVANWFGIPSYGNNISTLWAFIVLMMLIAIEGVAVWKIIRVVAGLAVLTDDGHPSLANTLKGTEKNQYGRELVNNKYSQKLIVLPIDFNDGPLKLGSNDAFASYKLLKSQSYTQDSKLRAIFGTYGGLTARLSGAIFYANGLFSLILSWRFVASWKNISFYWGRADSADGLDTPVDNKSHRRMIVVICFITICAVLEHCLSMISAIGLDSPPLEYFKRYILGSHAFLLIPEQYSLWTAIPIFFLSKIATILWNFQDLIIILISMGLTSRYHKLNSYVNFIVNYEKPARDRNKNKKHIQSQLWRRIREAYVRQAALVRMVDANIGGLILLSNVNNFYFICLQLFLGLNKSQGSLMNNLYYFISLSWLLFRACSVVLAAADVHIHSKQAMSCLQFCPGAEYNIEIKRLHNQLTYDYVALSGMKLFWLSRETLLQVAGNIIKYELVLIQYDK